MFLLFLLVVLRYFLLVVRCFRRFWPLLIRLVSKIPADTSTKIMIGELLAWGKYCSSALDGLTIFLNDLYCPLLKFTLSMKLARKRGSVAANDTVNDGVYADALFVGPDGDGLVSARPLDVISSSSVMGGLGPAGQALDLNESFPIDLNAVDPVDIVANFFPNLIVEIRSRVNEVLRDDDQVKRGLKMLETSGTTINDETWIFVITALSDRVARVVYRYVIDNLSYALGLLEVDELTKLLSQTAFRKSMPIIFEAMRRENQGFAVVSCDIDYFKPLNDDPNLGHDCGDMVLGKIGHVLASKVKKGVDIVARDGGEEFTIVLVGADLETAVARAEEIRKMIEEMVLEYRGRRFSCTMSFGVTAFDPERDGDFDTVKARAYKAFHYGKEAGRNRTVVAREGSSETMTPDPAGEGDVYETVTPDPVVRPEGVLWKQPSLRLKEAAAKECDF